MKAIVYSNYGSRDVLKGEKIGAASEFLHLRAHACNPNLLIQSRWRRTEELSEERRFAAAQPSEWKLV